MRTKIFCAALLAPLFSLFCAVAGAALPAAIDKAVLSTYPPAVAHKALKSAHAEPDPAKLRGFVVVEKGGVPAERARYFISFQEYDYRGVVVDLSKEGAVSTRRGKIYTYLKRGDVMAVAGVESFGRTIYLKLISAGVYVPGERSGDKHFSRVTVMLGFEFPKEVFKADDADAVIQAMGEWLKPFPNADAAEAYAKGIRAAPAVVAAPATPEASAENKAGKAIKAGKAKGAPAVPEPQSATDEAAAAEEAQRMKALEEKIDAAKKQMDEAEEQMKMLREEQKKLK